MAPNLCKLNSTTELDIEESLTKVSDTIERKHCSKSLAWEENGGSEVGSAW